MLILGSSILLYRTLAMISGGYLAINYWWVSTLLIGEFLSDLACLASSIWWFRIYFAAILAVLGVAGVVVIWRIRVRNRKAARD